MAKKKLEEPERWITVNGQHLPVYPGGRIGAPGQEPPKEKKTSKSGTDEKAREKVRKKLSGMSGIDQSKVAEMSEQTINGIKAGTFDRNAAKAYGLSDEDFDSLRASKKNDHPSAAKVDDAREIDLKFTKLGDTLEDMGNMERLGDLVMDSPVGTEIYSSDKNGIMGYKKVGDGKWQRTSAGLYGEAPLSPATLLDEDVMEKVATAMGEGTRYKIRNSSAKASAGSTETQKLHGQDVRDKKFSANSSAERINAISMSHNNGGSEGEDWKKVRTELDNAPAGTVMIQTGNRGAKFQYEKQADGNWKNTDTGYVQDSKTASMSWTGSGLRPQVEFTTSKNALTNEQVKASQDAAVSGRLNQALGLDRNGRKIGNRSTPKVDSSAPRTTSRNAKYDTGRSNKTSSSKLRSIVGDDGEWKISKAYDKTSLMNVALDAGVPAAQVRGMSKQELQAMLLSMLKGKK